MNNIEEKLWDYIDGNCPAEERIAIELLLTQDEAFQQKYLELLAFNREIAAMEIDEPSMAFTYKVIENIRADYAKQPLKTKTNSTIVNIIGGFFILTIAALLIFILVNINWTAAAPVAAAPLKMTALKNFIGSGVFKGFMFFDIVLGLFLLDGLLRKKGVSSQS